VAADEPRGQPKHNLLVLRASLNMEEERAVPCLGQAEPNCRAHIYVLAVPSRTDRPTTY